MDLIQYEQKKGSGKINMSKNKNNNEISQLKETVTTLSNTIVSLNSHIQRMDEALALVFWDIAKKKYRVKDLSKIKPSKKKQMEDYVLSLINDHKECVQVIKRFKLDEMFTYDDFLKCATIHFPGIE